MHIRKTFGWLALAAVLGLLLFRLGWYVRMARYTVKGIDVSHYQQAVDWRRVEREYAFVFIKATEGNHLKDQSFRQHWQTLGKLKMKRGAYHFFRPGADAVRQAEHFIRHVKLKPGDLPPVLDVEVTGNVPARQLVKGVRQWLRRVEGHYKIRPIVYTNHAFYRQYLQGEVEGYPIWIARYGWRTPQTRPAWHFWQYSDAGRVGGIAGKVDLNVFSGSLADLNRLCLP